MGIKNFTDYCKKHWKTLSIIVISVIIIFNIGSSLFIKKMGTLARLQPASVEVTELKTQSINKSFEFSGRVEAKYSVDLVARVQGFLQKSYFKEGDYVKKGQVLFLIEPNEYEIAVKNAQATLNATKASLINAEKNLVRAKALVQQDFVSKSYYDDALAKRDLYKGNIDANKAQLAQAKLDLSYTKITAPVDGKMGKILITQGNLVNLNKGAIAKLISTNPIYVTFTLKSEDYLKFKKADPTEDVSNTVVTVKLSDNTEFKEKGKIEFIDNAVDATAGTITMRATFNNPNGLLVPSDFVTVDLATVQPRKEIIVPQEAVQDSSDGLFVYVVTDKAQEQANLSFIGKINKKIDNVLARKFMGNDNSDTKIARIRHIKATEHYKNHWIVDEGLKEGDIIIVQGITTLKDGAAVKITKQD